MNLTVQHKFIAAMPVMWKLLPLAFLNAVTFATMNVQTLSFVYSVELAVHLLVGLCTFFASVRIKWL